MSAQNDPHNIGYHMELISDPFDTLQSLQDKLNQIQAAPGVDFGPKNFKVDFFKKIPANYLITYDSSNYRY